MNIADILEAAADDITVNGLAQGSIVNKQGQHCAVGALGYVIGLPMTPQVGFVTQEDYHNPTLHAAVDVLARSIPNRCGDRLWIDEWCEVVHWNNTPGRTAAEVADAMRHAAKDLRNENQIPCNDMP